MSELDLTLVDDDDFTQVGDARIVGIGYGTFTTLMFFIFILFVWLISDPVESGVKWCLRILTVLICTIGFLLMVYAEREERYVDQGIIVKEYDTSFNARTATFIIMVFFTVVSGLMFTKLHMQAMHQRTNVESAHAALW